MSALRVVLIYTNVPTPTLTAQFYTSNNVVANISSIVFSGTYTFVANGVTTVLTNQSSTASISVPLPTCANLYSVSVAYNSGSSRITSSDSIIIGSNYVIGNYLTQTLLVIPTKRILLNLLPLAGIIPANVLLTGNYRSLSSTFPVPAETNGIYQVAFTNGSSGTINYISTIDVIGVAFITNYIKITGEINSSNSKLYDSYGVPQNVTRLIFNRTFSSGSPQYRIYLNRVQVGSNTSLNLIGLAPGTLIDIESTDSKGIIVAARTKIIGCSLNSVTTPTLTSALAPAPATPGGSPVTPGPYAVPI